MRTIKLDNKKIHDYLESKDELVKSGRKISVEIEKIESEIGKLEADEKAITNEVNPTDLIDEGNALQAKINADIDALEKLSDKITKIKLDAIPTDIKDRHMALLKDREKLERDRNKVALKVQKVKDRVVPLIQVAMKSHLEQYEDIETAKINGQKVEVGIFSHLEQWKEAFAAKK